MSADIPRLITNLKLAKDDSHVMHHPAIEEVIAKLVEMEWQPIESAPKDGTRVMLGVVLTHPQQIGQEIDFYHMAKWCGEYWQPFVPTGWTHWQPLPKPPAIDAASGERK